MATTSNNIPQGYKATALGIIPQEWEVKKLGEVGKLLQKNGGVAACGSDFHRVAKIFVVDVCEKEIGEVGSAKPERNKLVVRKFTEKITDAVFGEMWEE